MTRPQDLSLRATEHTGPAPEPLTAEQRERLAQEKHERIQRAIKGDLPLPDRITAALKQVHDPEIPVNIHDLGLIYDVKLTPILEENATHGSHDVHVTMTLTSANCPAAQEIPVDVKKVLERLPEVRHATVEVVFDPPWSKDMMSEEAQLTMGLL